MSEAAYLFRQARERDCNRVVIRSELAQHPIQHRFVLANQPPLHRALGGVAEHIERRSAQSFELRQYAEGRDHPRAELLLAWQPGVRIATAQQRRRKVERDAILALELLCDALEEAAVDIQPRDLIFVLVSEKLEVI